MTEPTGPLAYEARGSVHRGGEATFETHGLSTAFDGSSGRLEELPGPADLLCAALCACILKNVERFSNILPFRYQSAQIAVTAEREAPPPRIARVEYHLRVVTDEPSERVELLHRNIRKFGTITNTLAAACELKGSLRVIRSDGSLEEFPA